MGISSGGAESFELIGVLIDAINRQYLFCIATATTENYNRFIENTALGESMTTIGVAEPTFNQTIQILESKASALEARYGIYLTYGTLEKTVYYQINIYATLALRLKRLIYYKGGDAR